MLSSLTEQRPTFGSALPESQGYPLCQRTLGSEVVCSGIGVHTGNTVNMRILPSDSNTGIIFIRTDLKNGGRVIPARWDRVIDTRLSTVIGNGEGGLVSTIEHLMATLRAFDVDNAIIEIDGPEVPIMDGSAAPFVELIEAAGINEQKAPRHEIVILKPVEAREGNKTARLEPFALPSYSLRISFNHKLISNQYYDFDLTKVGFKNEICLARTFGFFEEVEQLRQIGFARGGSLDNAVVIKDDKIINDGGLRYDDEFVRHKLLDAIGDMALACAPIRGRFIGNCSGHYLNNQLLRTLFADPEAWHLSESRQPQVVSHSSF